MKKHNILKVALLSILVVILCTWIFPSASYSSSGLSVGDRTQLGIFDLFSYGVELFRYFPYVILIAFATGIFYGVAYKIPAYQVVLETLAKKFSKKGELCLAIIMVLIAAIVSVTGLSFAIIFVFPFVISLVLLMGYNKLVAASVTLGSTMVGILGTTLGYNTTYYINSLLGTTVFDEMITKVCLLVISLAVLIFNVLLYAKKTKNNTDKVVELVPAKKDTEKETVKAEKVKKEEKTSNTKTSSKKKTTSSTSKTKATASKKKTSTKKTTTKAKTRAYDLKSKTETKVTVKKGKSVKIWPFILVFDLVVVILALSSISWSEVYEISLFTDALTAINEFEIGGFTIFAKILGSVSAFGSWSLSYEIPTLICLATCFLAFIYGLKLDDFLDGVVTGVKKAFAPAMCMLLVYLVLVIATYNPFQLNITKFILDITGDLNVVLMSIIALISSVINVEVTYAASSTLPYVTSIVTDSTLYPLLAIIFQAIYGLTMLVAPTSVILLGTLSYLGISYGQWLKHIWKLFLELFVVILIILFIVFLI